jgi:hypothetical protein
MTKNFRAPSWSWASCEGSVLYYGGDHQSQINALEAKMYG